MKTKLLIPIVLLIITNELYSQQSNSQISFIAEKYKDTLVPYSQYNILFKVQNNSTKAISIMPYWFTVYYKAVYVDNPKDTINTIKDFENIDVSIVTPPTIKIIQPAKSEKFTNAVFNHNRMLKRVGKIRIKFFYRNSTESDELEHFQTDWILIYVKPDKEYY